MGVEWVLVGVDMLSFSLSPTHTPAIATAVNHPCRHPLLPPSARRGAFGGAFGDEGMAASAGFGSNRWIYLMHKLVHKRERDAAYDKLVHNSMGRDSP